MEVYVDDEAKLTLHGLQQHYVKLKENEKNKKLFELLDVLEFNQVSKLLILMECFQIIIKNITSVSLILPVKFLVFYTASEIWEV